MQLRAQSSVSLAVLVDETLVDVRAAFRALRRDLAFTIVAVVTLTIAIGLNVAAFAVMDGVLFRGFPLVKGNDRLLFVKERYPGGQCCITFADFAAWREEATSFEDLAFVDGRELTLRDGVGGGSVDVSAAALTANTFGLLGVQPSLGRDFVAGDEAPGAAPVAILSHGFWQARFGGEADAVGRTVAIDGVPATIVGVMPEGFAFPSRHALWVPLAHTPELEQRTPNGYLAVGRLAAGATRESAGAELAAINLRLAGEFPQTNRGVVPSADTYARFFLGADSPAVYAAVWAASWFVLLVACANLANLTLARMLGRSRELGTRLALGAGRSRLGRQLVAENLLPAALGGVLGWFAARGLVAVWARATESEYRIIDYTVDSRTLGYLVGVLLFCVAIFAIVPLVRVLRLDTSGIARSDARGTRNRRDKRFVGALVAIQMTLAIVLLGGAGVLARSFLNVVEADAGVREPDKVLIGWAALPRSALASAAERAAFFEALRERLAAIPGVTSASISNSRPVNNTAQQRFEIEGRAVEPDAVESAPIVTAGPGYFATVGAATVAGREFGAADGAGGPLTAVVNERFAAEYFGAASPVGRRLRLYDGGTPGEWRTIVGVVSNIMESEPTRQRFVPLVYLPFAEAPWRGAWFFARVDAPSVAVVAAVRAAVRSSHPDVVLEDLSTLEESFGFIASRMDLAHVELGKYAAVAPLFAAVALLLAGLGLFAVVAYAVGQRTREIGIRIAVGAKRNDIRRLVFGEELKPVAAGLGVGLIVSLAANRVLESQLVGVSPYDPVTLLLAAASLTAVALAACQIPSRRAMRVDPVVALRDD